MENIVYSADDNSEEGTLQENIEASWNRLKDNPKDWDTRVSLGNSYFRKGMLKEAREQFEWVVEAISNNIIAYKMLGEIFEKEGNRQKAYRLYQIYTAFNPDDVKAKQIVSSFRTEEPLTEKEKPVQSRVVESSDNSQRQINIFTKSIAEIYERQGYLEKSLNTYEDILVHDPENILIQKKVKSLIERVRQRDPAHEEDTLHSSQTDTVIVTLKKWLFNLQKSKEQSQDSPVMGGANEKNTGHPWS